MLDNIRDSLFGHLESLTDSLGYGAVLISNGTVIPSMVNPDWEPDTHGSLYLNNVLSKSVLRIRSLVGKEFRVGLIGILAMSVIEILLYILVLLIDLLLLIS